MKFFKKAFIVSPLLFNSICSPIAYAEHDVWQIEIQTGVLNQKYKEPDTSNVTSNGVLNNEKGQLPHIQVSVLNTLGASYGEVTLAYAQGDTDYNGYLQSNAQLIPYKAKTDNAILKSELTFGFNKYINNQIILKPHITGSYYKWSRGLEQYTEKFDHTAVLLGLGVDWQAKDYPLLLNATADYGYLTESNITVNKFNLEQSLGGNAIWQVGLYGQYAFENNVAIKVDLSHAQWKYDKSNIENNYQYPGSSNQQTSLDLALNYTY